MAAFNNHNQQRISQGIPQGMPQGNYLNGSRFNHGAQNNLATPQQLNHYQYGHQDQIVQPQNHFQMEQCLIWAQQEAQAQQQRLKLAQEQRQQQDFHTLRQWQQPDMLQQRQQQPHMLQQRHQQQPHMLQQSHHQQHPHTLQQSHPQQNPKMSQQGHILQQNQQQQPHILQQRHQQQSQQQQHPHIFLRGQRQQPHVLQQNQQQQSHILQQRHQQQLHMLQQSQHHPHILQRGQRQQPHVLQQSQQQHTYILKQDQRQQPHVLQKNQQQHNNPPTIVAASQLNQFSNRTPNSSNPNLVQGSATREEVPCLQNEDLKSPVINHGAIIEYLDTVEAAEQKNTSGLVKVVGLESKPEPKHKSEPIESRPEPELIEFKPETRHNPKPIESVTKPILLPSLGPVPELISVPEPKASTLGMPNLEPRPKPRTEPSSVLEPEASTSSMPSMLSLGPTPETRSVPEPEATTSSTTSGLEVSGKLCPNRKRKSKTTYRAVAEENTSSMPIIESGSGSEPSPSTSRHSSTTSDFEVNDVGGKKRKRKPKKLYRALAEDDSTEYETDDEEPRKVQKTAGWKTDKYKSQPEKENLPQLSANKITNTAAKIETPKDLSKSEIRKSKAWQSRWNLLYDKLHFDALNKHLDNIFSSKTLGFETKKSFKGEGKTNIIKANKIIIEKCKNLNNESTIVPKTKCSLCKGTRENHYTKCKHLVNDNSDSDYHSNSDNTLNYVVDSQMDHSSNYSSEEGQVNTQQDHLVSIKPFNCNFCGFTFTQKINMENHIAIVHEGKKPYTCDLCKKVFWKESHLNIHLTLKHERQKNLDSTGINVIEPQSIFVYGNLKPTELAFPLMCVLALQSSPVKKMSVSEIYTFIKKHWPYFQTAKKTWFEKTVRDAMRNNKFFEYTNQVAIKIKKSDGKMNRGRNGKYYILSKSMGKKMKSELKKYVGNNQQEIQASTSNPEVFSWIDKIEEETEQAINRVKIPKESRVKRVLKNPLKPSIVLTDGHVNTEANPEPGPKPEPIIKSKSEPRPKPEPIKTKTKPRPKPELIESKPEPRPKPELIESKPKPRPKPEHIESKLEPRPKPELTESKPEEENNLSMPIIEFGSELEPSTSPSSRCRRNRGGF